MKILLLSVATLLTISATYAQTWTVDKAHSKVGFAITHMMLTEVDGGFKNFDAKLTGKPDMTDAQFEMTADVNSINTDNEMRDGHLKGDKWFDAAKFDKVSFKSTGFQKVSGNKYKLMGNLTMHGVTKPVMLDATVLGPVVNKNREGKEITKVGIKTSGQIKRSDFGVGGVGAMSPVSDEVDLRINGEFAMQ